MVAEPDEENAFFSKSMHNLPQKGGGVAHPDAAPPTQQPPKPDVLPVAAMNVPDELKEVPQWVCWRLEWREGKDGKEGKWTKPPYQPNTRRASVTNPETWSDFRTALTAWLNDDFDGIGFVVTDEDDFCGIDLDGWRDPVTGEMNDRARDVIARLDSYTEISPSGCGVRIWVKGKLPPGKRRDGDKSDGAEAYDTARFLTFTGQWYPGSPRTVNEPGAALAQFHADYLAPPEPKEKPQREGAVDVQPLALDDEQLLEKARAAKNGAKFAWLWAGDVGNNASGADLALCNELAFWTRRDPARIDALFRRSGLMRPKWDEVHRPADGATYGKMTIEKAIALPGDTYTGQKSNGAAPPTSTLGAKAVPTPEVEPLELPTQPDGATSEISVRFRRSGLQEIFERPSPDFLIYGILPQTGTALLNASQGSFKSFLALDMALCVATGKDFHGRKVKRGRVLYIAAEGAETTRDRARAWLGVWREETPDQEAFPAFFEQIEEPIEIADARERAAFLESLEGEQYALIIIDTLTLCAQTLEENSATEMGAFFAACKLIADATGALVLACHHNNKEGKVRGSTAMPAAASAHLTLKRSERRSDLRTVLGCEKMRGFREFDSFAFQGHVFDLGELDSEGQPRTSLYFEACDAPVPEEETQEASGTEMMRADVLEVLRSNFPKGASATEWQARCEALGICKSSAFYKRRDELKKRGEIACTIGKYLPTDSPTPPTPPTPPRSKTDFAEHPQTKPTPHSTNSTLPIGSGVGGVNGVGVAELKTKPKSPQKKRAAKDSEPYNSPSVVIGEGAEIEEGTL